LLLLALFLLPVDFLRAVRLALALRLAVDFLPVRLLAVDFLRVVRLALALRLAVDFLPVRLLAVDFLPVVRLPLVLRLAVDFLPVVRLPRLLLLAARLVRRAGILSSLQNCSVPPRHIDPRFQCFHKDCDLRQKQQPEQKT
jgi:hypothetical protein